MLRAQTGDEGFDRVEAIRQTSVRFHRASTEEEGPVQAELHGLLDALDGAQTLTVVRAFSYFSLLANIAEDVHQNRRRRAHRLAGDPPPPGSRRPRPDAPGPGTHRPGARSARSSRRRW